MRSSTLLFLFVILIVSCDNKKQEEPNILSRDQIVDILTDIQLIEAKLSFEKKSPPNLNEISEKYYESVFLKYDISKEEFEKSLNYYKQNIEELNNIYSEVITKLNKIQSQINTTTE